MILAYGTSTFTGPPANCSLICYVICIGIMITLHIIAATCFHRQPNFQHLYATMMLNHKAYGLRVLASLQFFHFNDGKSA